MIVEFLITILTGIVYALITFLPEPESLPSAINTAMTEISGYYNQANALFPMDTLFQLIGLMLTIELGIMLFKLVNFIFTKLTGH